MQINISITLSSNDWCFNLCFPPRSSNMPWLLRQKARLLTLMSRKSPEHVTGTHHEDHGMSNHTRLDCLLKSLLRQRSKETFTLTVTGPRKERSLSSSHHDQQDIIDSVSCALKKLVQELHYNISITTNIKVNIIQMRLIEGDGRCHPCAIGFIATDKSTKLHLFAMRNKCDILFGVHVAFSSTFTGNGKWLIIIGL